MEERMLKGWKLLPGHVIWQIAASFAAELNPLVRFEEVKFQAWLCCFREREEDRPRLVLPLLPPLHLGGRRSRQAVREDPILPGNRARSQAATSDHRRDQHFC